MVIMLDQNIRIQLSLLLSMDDVDAFDIAKYLAENANFSSREIKELGFALGKREGSDDAGKGTIWLSSLLEFEEVVKEFEGKLVSPSVAAEETNLSRARIHQMETEGKIRAYRIKADFFDSENFTKEFDEAPFWVRAMFKDFSPRRFIFIPEIDLDDFRRDRD
jgi:hypothetical protein